MSELPRGWASTTLEALTTHVTSGSRDWSPYYDRGTATFLMAQNVRPGRLDLSFRQLVDPPKDDRSRERSQVLRGDLLVTIVGANTGNVCRVPFELPEHYVCQSVALVRPGPAVLPGFIDLFLNSPLGQSQFAEFMYGQGRPHLSFEQLRATRVVVPPLPEQRRIVEAVETHFTRLDAAVTTLKRVRANLKRCRAAVLQAAVEGWLGEPRVSPGALPSGWGRKRMPMLATILSGNTPAGIAGLVSESGEIPWFRVGDMNEPGNEVRLHRSRTWLSRTQASDLGLRLLPIGTIVFPKRGGAIRTNKKRMLTRDSTIDLNTMALVPEPGVGPWLWLWMQQLDLGTLADGSNVPQINHSDVAPLAVPLPPIPERDEIIERAERYLSEIDAVGNQVDRGIGRCANLRQSLLRIAFDGRLVCQDSRDEPASVLLDRIRAERAAASSPPKQTPRRSRR